jgi:hypothetical protein
LVVCYDSSLFSYCVFVNATPFKTKMVFFVATENDSLENNGLFY